MDKQKEIADQVVGHFQTQTAVAKALGYDDVRNVTHWVKGIRPFPPEHCVTLERASGGRFDRKALRPYDWQRFWPEEAA